MEMKPEDDVFLLMTTVRNDSEFENRLLFLIKPDGTIERGPAFTTTDEMSLEFWAAIERNSPAKRNPPQ